MKPQQRRRRRVPAAAATVAIICMVGVGGVSAESSSSSSSSSIRGVGGSGRVTRNSAAAASNRQQHYHHQPNNRQREQQQQQQQQQRYLNGNSDGKHTRGRHRKSDGDDDGTDSNEQEQEQPQTQPQYSWNINPDKLAMLEATTTTSDSDRQEDESSSSELDEPQQEQQQQQQQAMNDDVTDDGVNDDDDGDGEEGGASLSHHRDEAGDDDGAVNGDDDETNGDNNMVSMGASFAYGTDHPAAEEEEEEEDATVSEEESASGSNGIGGGMSVYSLSDNTPPSESAATTTTSPGEEGVYFFPIWNDHVEGCTYYTTPPEEYVASNEETQYLFSTKLDCCMAWFQKLEEYEACLDEDIILTDHPVTMKEWGMVYEVQEERDDDDDDDNMVAQSAPAQVASPSDTSSFGETMPHHDDEYYPANYADNDAPSPASSPESQPMPNQEEGYYPTDFEDSAPPAASPESQPMPHHEGGYYPANNADSDAPPAPSPQSPPQPEPMPHHEDGYYPANYVAPSPSSNFDSGASPPPTESVTTTVEDEDAISGESIISDLVLEAKLKDNTIMPALKLQASPEDVAWEITKHDFDYDGGKYVLSANTRKVILGLAANSHGISTYHGSATMSVTIMAGPAGGVLNFGSYSNARAPIEVLQVKVDDLPMIAVTSPSSEWVDHTLEIPAGKHVVTFSHISNPEELSMKDLEGLGKPGSTMVDGLKYVDNVGPPEEFTSSAITEAPTTSPWSESDDEETVDSSTTTLPMQNYCGESLALIQESCYTDDAPPTCNDGDGPCREGLFCWGNVECQVPEGEVAGGVSALETPTVQVTSAPTSSPTALTSESFLDSFMFEDGSQSSTSDQEVKKQTGCMEGYPPVQGLAGCCVPEPTFLGDGACDAHFPYNTAECGYDLGDCCKESCDTEAQFGCKAKEGDAYGPFGFYCIDPQYSTIDESCTAENREWIGDGGCDKEFNTEACGWDGGDCCRETCDTEFAYYECGREEQPFNCLDPDIIHQFEYVPGKR